MEMSYRRAWLLIDEVNGIFGNPVVETATGGTGGGGAKITPLGEAVIAAFRDIESNATELVQTRLASFSASAGAGAVKLEAYNAFCMKLPHATHVVQWGGAHVWKIGGKVFAVAGWNDGKGLAVTFKCSQIELQSPERTGSASPGTLSRVTRHVVDSAHFFRKHE